MAEQRIDRLEQRYGVMAMASEVPGQYYLMEDAGNIAVVLPPTIPVVRMQAQVQNGRVLYDRVVGLTREQAKLLVEELSWVLEGFE